MNHVSVDLKFLKLSEKPSWDIWGGIKKSSTPHYLLNGKLETAHIPILRGRAHKQPVN